jgi:osmoprotectant transport system ATP-binding protein
MIKAEKLSRKFGDFTAVNQVTFEVKKGETLVLIGPSGCGKTTTLKMLNRLIAPTSGSVWVDKENTHDQAVEQLRRKMGYVIQNIGLFPHYTIADNIAIVPRLLKWDDQEIRDRSMELMNQLALPAEQFAHKYPHELSGGQQQRVGIARALAAKPPILLMDEPFGALDPLTRQQIRRDFMELEELRATTIVMVTHDIEEAFEMGTKICLLDKGVIQQLGTPNELLTQPANDFVKAFIAEQAERLELRAVKLRDVFELIANKSDIKSYLPLSAATSLLRAIYLLGKSEEEYIRVEYEGVVKYANAEYLFQLFRQTIASWKR